MNANISMFIQATKKESSDVGRMVHWMTMPPLQEWGPKSDITLYGYNPSVVGQEQVDPRDSLAIHLT